MQQYNRCADKQEWQAHTLSMIYNNFIANLYTTVYIDAYMNMCIYIYMYVFMYVHGLSAPRDFNLSTKLEAFNNSFHTCVAVT